MVPAGRPWGRGHRGLTHLRWSGSAPLLEARWLSGLVVPRPTGRRAGQGVPACLYLRSPLFSAPWFSGVASWSVGHGPRLLRRVLLVFSIKFSSLYGAQDGGLLVALGYPARRRAQPADGERCWVRGAGRRNPCSGPWPREPPLERSVTVSREGPRRLWGHPDPRSLPAAPPGPAGRKDPRGEFVSPDLWGCLVVLKEL